MSNIPNDPYYDIENHVMKNKLGILDSTKLEKVEYAITSIKVGELKRNKEPKIKNIQRLQNIHKYIFQDIYEWAGKLRTVDMSKDGHNFMPQAVLPTAMQYLDSQITEFQAKKHDSVGHCCKDLSIIILDINEMHPFREGNGRTQREFIRQLLNDKGLKLDTDLLQQNNKYMQASIKDDHTLMAKALEESIEIHTLEKSIKSPKR